MGVRVGLTTCSCRQLFLGLRLSASCSAEDRKERERVYLLLSRDFPKVPRNLVHVCRWGRLIKGKGDEGESRYLVADLVNGEEEGEMLDIR